MPFINSDLNKQPEAQEVRTSRTKKNHITHKPVSTILFEKLNFYHHILVRNAQMYIRLENLVS